MITGTSGMIANERPRLLQTTKARKHESTQTLIRGNNLCRNVFAEVSQRGWANQTQNDAQLNENERDCILRTAWVVLCVNCGGKVKCVVVKRRMRV